MLNDFNNHFKFIVKSGITFNNAKYVHPLMQEAVQSMLCELSSSKIIQRVVIFGSAVDFRCNQFSDLDVYLDLDVQEEHFPKFSKDWGVEVDLVYRISKESLLYQEIMRTGIIVWERTV